MDRNKEEALKAKEQSEMKMQNKDFTGARKLALRAQNLYPDLENISQLLTVCEVHSVAEQRSPGNETNWYGVLQVEQTADEATIKKQYRKFALILHPDKNKFPGAEGAFKMIGEAQIVLLDRDKRSAFDMKRKVSSVNLSAIYRPSQQATWNTNSGLGTNFGSNFTNSQNQQPQQKAQSEDDTGSTFWTACPFCSSRFEYQKEMLFRSLRCENCDKPFIAYNVNIPGAQSTPNVSHGTYFRQKDILNHGTCKVNIGRSQGNTKPEKPRTVSVRKKRNRSSKVASRKVNGEGIKKRVVESSERRDTESSSDSDSDIIIDEGRERKKWLLRRSTRSRHGMSYQDNFSDDDDDDFVYIPKMDKGGASSCANEEAASKGETMTKDKNVQSDYSYADPDFSDFEKGRKEGCFAPGDTWAAYDTVDAMPRFYAVINKVFSSGFKLQITWLEPDPDEEEERKWVNKDLPVSCGKFVLGNSEMTKNKAMFSHKVTLRSGSLSGSYKVYPRRGETWALFRNWNINWNSIVDPTRGYEYDFVEILVDYSEKHGILVTVLVKVKGFACLFCRDKETDEDFLRVPAPELFRFSHRVPSFKMTGDEKDGVPKGSFELDPAALPSMEESSTSEN